MSFYDYYYTSSGTATAPAGTADTTTVTEAIAALNPTAHWRLAETSGTAAADETGNHGGTYVNTPTLGVTGWAADGTGITLDRASNEGVLVPDHADNDLGTSDATFLIAVNPGVTWYTGASQALFSKGAGNPYMVAFSASAENRTYVYLVDTAYSTNLSTDISDGNFHLLMWTLDRDGLASYYVDGNTTPEGTHDISAKSAADLSSAHDLYIGTGNTSYPFGGSLQHAAYWKGTLITPAQFADIWAARSNA